MMAKPRGVLIGAHDPMTVHVAVLVFSIIVTSQYNNSYTTCGIYNDIYLYVPTSKINVLFEREESGSIQEQYISLCNATHMTIPSSVIGPKWPSSI